MSFHDIYLVTSLFDNIIYQEPPPFFATGIWWRIRAIGWEQVKRISFDRDSWREGKRSTLYDLARVTLLKRASDPRDTLYALVGLATASFLIDYTRNVNEIYCDFTEVDDPIFCPVTHIFSLATPTTRSPAYSGSE